MCNSSETGAHIFYSFDNIDRYIQNACTFISESIRNQQPVLLLENDRLFPLIYKELKYKWSNEELDKLSHINNFDFYCSNGEFHPQTMVRYFFNKIKPLRDGNIPIRTWAHVEWGIQEEITKLIMEFEELADPSVSNMNLVSVCAYDSSELTGLMKRSLLKSHGYYMTDTQIVPC
ncbi:MEDS domain-containing protein [Peribacillus deserti]|uniref:3-ketoacyl-ACP reductase n=1 Tax=Peribacillus deserti TaxID=673318 RepID=A0A2N5M3E4_9BACI|nr:MEDS domain-containing protein [Peribacillus deserti]PLT28880.1 3-ketoacyl-ACP reductase [Peribacillus deserti]